jgi:xanthine dehydrogenase accessory factor
MESLDHSVLRDALAWHGAGHRVSLITVVQTWGSAPRPPGALLAIRDDGVVSGSVSGGCVEDDLIARTQATLRGSASAAEPDKPSVIAYGVTQEEAARFGLPCGGSLRLVQETLIDASWVAQLLARIEQHQLVARTLDMASGAVQLHDAARGQALQFDGATLSAVFGPKWRLLLIGAGQISRAVAQMAGLLDFEVLCCDPREEYASSLAADCGHA